MSAPILVDKRTRIRRGFRISALEWIIIVGVMLWIFLLGMVIRATVEPDGLFSSVGDETFRCDHATYPR